MSCTGWTFLSGCSTSCVQQSIDVCSTRHHSTWRTAASTPQTLLVASICGLLAAINYSCRDIGVRCSVIWPFLWPARRPGTRYQTTCEIRHIPLTAFAGTWKFFLFYSHTQHIRGFAIMRYINLLLTFGDNVSCLSAASRGIFVVLVPFGEVTGYSS